MTCRVLRAGLVVVGLALLLARGPSARAESCSTPPSNHPGAESVELLPLGGGLHGRLSFPPVAPDAKPLPAVLLAGDSLGWDPRQERYVGRLVAHGLAVLELIGEDEAPGTDAAASLRLASALLACHPRIDPGRIGVLGFGAGAAPLLPMRRPRALLYPGCTGLRRSLLREPDGAMARLGQGPVLLLHGDADPANPPEDCAILAALLAEAGPVRRIAYRGVGYAWDLPAYGAPHAIRLPRPDGPGLLPVAPWPELAEISAEQVAGFFFLTLRPAG